MLQTDTAPRRAVDLTGVGFVSQLVAMVRLIRAARERNVLMGLGAGLLLVIGATAYGQIELNAWNRPFYNALSHKELPEALLQLGVFAFIAGALLILNVAQTWLNQMARMKLREALTRDLVTQWLMPDAPFC